MKERLGRAALHVHTDRSDGLKSPQECLRLACEAGVDALAITDHDTIEGALVALWEAGRQQLPIGVIVSQEVSTSQGHLLGLGLVKEIPMFLSLEETVRRIHEQGGLAVACHVGWGIPPASIAPETIARLYEKGEELDGIEVLNPYYKPRHTIMAMSLQEKFNLAAVGTNDDHFGNFGRGFSTLFPGKTVDDLRRAIKNRETIAFIDDLPPLEAPPQQRVLQIFKGLARGLPKKLINSPCLISTLIALRLDELSRLWR